MHTIPESSDNALNIDPMRYADLKANCLHAVVIETTGGSYCRRCGQWFNLEETHRKTKNRNERKGGL
jgi:hypothetical protein